MEERRKVWKIMDDILNNVWCCKARVPNFGYLMRNDDGTVGVFLHWYDMHGYMNYSKEPTTFTTISSWAESHA